MKLNRADEQFLQQIRTSGFQFGKIADKQMRSLQRLRQAGLVEVHPVDGGFDVRVVNACCNGCAVGHACESSCPETPVLRVTNPSRSRKLPVGPLTQNPGLSERELVRRLKL